MKEVFDFLGRAKTLKPKIAVVGDGMVDQYFNVAADRVSPEFPIPVMLSETSTSDVCLPGGAANVCRQFGKFDIDVKFLGFIDRAAKVDYDKYNINCEYCVSLENGRMIPRKKRFYHGQFPLCRWDVETFNYGLEKEELRKYQEELYEKFLQLDADVVILSDYDKGVFTGGPFWAAQLEGKITIVDPKKGPVEKWRGCTVFKPNAKEAKELSGADNWKTQCDFFQRRIGCMSVVITQGGDGVVGKVGGRYFDFHPDRKISADSVIGAGDCFAAFLAMTLAHGMDIVEGVKVAFEAGSLYVQRKHNEPVTSQELIMYIDSRAAKFSTPPQERDYTLVFTNGCYDILHPGHLKVLEEAKSFGDKLVVGVNSDESIRVNKGDKRPIMNLQERMNMLAALECVDFVVPFEERTPYALVKSIMPDILVKGSDWADKTIVGSDLVKDVRFVELLEGMSTSDIIKRACK